MLRLKSNYDLVLMNNEGTDWNDYRLRKFRLNELFDKKLTSCIIKEAKPHLSYYMKVISILKIKPSELLFIDNSLDNVKAAKKLEIKTIHFRNPQQLRKDLLKCHIGF